MKPIVTVRLISTEIEAFEALNAFYQKRGLEFKGVVPSTYGSGSGHSGAGVGQSSMYMQTTVMAYYMGHYNDKLREPSIGDFKGKLHLRKVGSDGFLKGSSEHLNDYRLENDYAELDVLISLKDGTCTASWTVEGKKFTQTASYVREDDAIHMFSRSNMTVVPSLLCGNWNPFAQPRLTVGADGNLSLRVRSSDFERSYTFAK